MSSIILEEEINYSKLIRDYRSRFKISQAEFAEMVGASLYSIFGWEYKNTKPSYKFRKRIKEIIDTPSNLTETKDYKNIIKNYRSKFNLTQKDLAKTLGTSKSTILRWKCGKGTPNYKFCKKISELISES